MKYINIGILLIIFLSGCQDKYHGYIIDAFTSKPIAGVEIHDMQWNKSTFTDSAGYYKVDWKDPGFEFWIKKVGYAIDTVKMYYPVSGEYLAKTMDGRTRSLLPIFTGEVYDQQTNKPLKDVSIYDTYGYQINTTAVTGYFALNRFPYGGSIVFKKEHYQDVTVTLFKITDHKRQTMRLLRKLKGERTYLIPAR